MFGKNVWHPKRITWYSTALGNDLHGASESGEIDTIAVYIPKTIL
jgi:hypothetical protein